MVVLKFDSMLRITPEEELSEAYRLVTSYVIYICHTSLEYHYLECLRVEDCEYINKAAHAK